MDPRPQSSFYDSRHADEDTEARGRGGGGEICEACARALRAQGRTAKAGPDRPPAFPAENSRSQGEGGLGRKKGVFYLRTQGGKGWGPVPWTSRMEYSVRSREMEPEEEAIARSRAARIAWVWASPRQPWVPTLSPSRQRGQRASARAHLVSAALTLTGALGVHPQVGAELVGAHTRVVPGPRRQAGPRSQPSQQEQRQEWPQGRHGDRGPRGWGGVAAGPSPPQALLSLRLQASTLPGLRMAPQPSVPGLPSVPQGRCSQQTLGGFRVSGAESVHVAPAPPPPGPSGQLKAGGGERGGSLGRGQGPGAQRHWP